MTDSETPFLSVGPYVDVPADLQAPLECDIRADVAIVGGGLTGLSTALALKKAGIDAVILEREFCGYGASGRNAGHLTPTICKDMPTAIMLFGRERAGKLASFADHCVETAEQLIANLGIDCDYHASGNIMSVVHPAQEARLRKATAAARAIGARVRFIEPGEMRERGIPKAFLCGALEEAGGTLHPGKLVMGLRRAALDAGIRIYEQTKVQHVTRDTPARVITDRCTVSADRVVMASNAWTPEIGEPGHRLFAFNVTLFETDPLTDAQVDAIGGWPGREGIYTAHESLVSYRLTAQRTLIGGSRHVRYFFGGKPSAHGGAEDASMMANLDEFRDRFPALDDLGFAHAWSGWIGMTMNFMPIIGESPRRPGLYYGVGYNGHGVAQALKVGELLAGRIQGRDDPWYAVISRKPAYLPPEPFRWLGVRSLLGLVNAIDAHRNRQIVRHGIGR
jgi:glycine/D-amino acid oxidase-like deaminating enzyme